MPRYAARYRLRIQALGVIVSDVTTIKTIRTQILADIESITLTPKPTYTIDGQTVQWADYLTRLWQAYHQAGDALRGGEPVEVTSQGYT